MLSHHATSPVSSPYHPEALEGIFCFAFWWEAPAGSPCSGCQCGGNRPHFLAAEGWGLLGQHLISSCSSGSPTHNYWFECVAENWSWSCREACLPSLSGPTIQTLSEPLNLCLPQGQENYSLPKARAIEPYSSETTLFPSWKSASSKHVSLTIAITWEHKPASF